MIPGHKRFFRISLLILAVLALLSCQRHDTLPHFPGSTLIFRKFYPENEILGMASDRQWREVRITNSAVEVILQWYQTNFPQWQRLSTRTSPDCTTLAWQKPAQGNDAPVQLHVVICNHDGYRTLLTITPQL